MLSDDLGYSDICRTMRGNTVPSKSVPRRSKFPEKAPCRLRLLTVLTATTYGCSFDRIPAEIYESSDK